MKVIINKGVGSFELSKKVIDELIELGWTHRDSDIIHKETDRQTDIMYSANKDYYAVNFFKHNIDSNAFRTNADLIKVIAKLDDKSAGCGEYELKIVEIPDDIEWYIESDSESGGYEVIHEKHRTWE